MTPYEQVMDSIRQLSGMELMSDGGKAITAFMLDEYAKIAETAE